MGRHSRCLFGSVAISLQRWWFCAAGTVRPPPDDVCMKVWRWPRFTRRWIAAFFVANAKPAIAFHAAGPARSLLAASNSSGGERLQAVAPGQFVEPRGRSARHAPQGAGELSRDRGHGIGVISEIGGQNQGILDGLRPVHAPQRRFERVQDVSRRGDGVALFCAPRTGGHVGDQRVAGPASAAHNGLLRRTGDRLDQQFDKERTRLHCLRGAVGGSALQPGGRRCFGPVAPPADRHRREPHE